MPERANSFAPLLCAALFVFVATIAVSICSSARAESACIEQPSQPTAAGTHWSLRSDRGNGRKCWVLVDANGREVALPQAQPNAASALTAVHALSSQVASWLGNLTGASANVASQGNPPQGTGAQTGPAGGPRKPHGVAAIASKTDNGVQAGQRSAGEGHAAKPGAPPLTEPERDALFEEFLRWQESRESMSTLGSQPPSR